MEKVKRNYSSRRKFILSETKKKKKNTESVCVGIIPAVTQVYYLEPEKNWLSGMEHQFPIGVKHFKTIMKINHYESFESMCADIKNSYTIFERNFLNNFIEFTDEIKITVELLQLALVKFFKKIQAEALAEAW